jgi:hypothetical protein
LRNPLTERESDVLRGAQGEVEQGVQPVALGGGEELAGFAGGERLEAAGAGGADLNVAGDVAGDLFFEDGVFEGGFEDGVDVVEGQRGQQALILRYGLDMTEREIAERQGVTRQAVNHRLIQGVGRIVATLNGRSDDVGDTPSS